MNKVADEDDKEHKKTKRYYHDDALYLLRLFFRVEFHFSIVQVFKFLA